MRLLPVLFASFLHPLLVSQAASPRLTLDGVALRAPTATLSPLGWLELRGEREGGTGFVAKLRFALLEWPAAGEHAVGPQGLDLRIGDDPTGAGDAVTGTTTIAQLDLERARLRASLERAGTKLEFDVDLPVQLYVPKWQPEVVGKFTPPVDAPNQSDLVFCAIGNVGTGLPGQRRIAEAIAALAPTGPLDFVIVPGNVFWPRGVKDKDDPLFKTRFEQVYDQQKLAVPFYVTMGPVDLRGSADAFLNYGALNTRWTGHPMGYTGELTCRGKQFGTFGGNSEWMTGPMPNPRTRSAMRTLLDQARDSKADWKIVTTAGQLLSLGDPQEAANVKGLDERSRVHLQQGKVDLVIDAHTRGMRMVVRAGEIPQITAGGGGGSEIGAIPSTPPGTVFAYGGGGFVWFRFDGQKLQVSFRDETGKVLYAHELTKQ